MFRVQLAVLLSRLRLSRRSVLTLSAAATAACAFTLAFPITPAAADFGFAGLESAFSEEDGSAAVGAGTHPFAWRTTLAFNTLLGPGGGPIPDQALKDLRIQFPPGVVGTPALLPKCSRDEFLDQSCPPDTQVGSIALDTSNADTEGKRFPVYNLSPLPGTPAEIGFVALTVPVTIEIGINPEPPNNLVASLTNASQLALLFGSELSIGGIVGSTPFLTLPRSCTGPLVTTFEADSWQVPGRWVAGQATSPGVGGCEGIGFSPRLGFAPSTNAGGVPSGLDATLDLPDEWGSAAVSAQSDLRDASFLLPEGMTVNPSVAAGLSTCRPDELAREASSSAPGTGCPESAKIGTASIESPLFAEPLSGNVYVAQPDDPATAKPGAENPFDALFALYVVIDDPSRGVLVERALKIDPAPTTGRLTATVRELPQLPISHLELHLRDGPRAPLRTPAACGNYESRYRLNPWSGNAQAEGTSSFAIVKGCGGDEFSPRLRAGTVDPRGGASSPFVLDLERQDGEQALAGFSLSLPPGLSAELGPVPLCPQIRASTGSCPANSRVGSVSVAIGSGQAPLWLPPTAETPAPLYLAGPDGGAPFSIVAAVPTQAGPFNLGTVVLRAAIRVSPTTGKATIEADRLPQIVSGVPIDYRVIHLELTRPGLIRNPTSCQPLRVGARLTSTQGRLAATGDLFQATGCERLRFRPSFALGLLGSSRRGGYPRLRAVLKTQGREANVEQLSATLPASELLDQRHLRSVCSRARFAQGKCPPGSVYGHAKVMTPLLGEPLEGPVYLRAGQGRLPDLVASVAGQIRLDLVARLSSVRGRLQVRFQDLPDAPLRKVVLSMEGGRHGLFVNTGGVCRGDRRITTILRSHSGRSLRMRPRLRRPCPAAGR